MAIAGYGDFYKWATIFGLKPVGDGSIPASYGMMYIGGALSNTRPTYGVYPSTTWYKVEAGPSAIPTSPPDYSGYNAGALRDWIFDVNNAQLIYAGVNPGYYKISVTGTSALNAGTITTQIRYAVRKNNDTNLAITGQSTTQTSIAPGAISETFATEVIDFFQNGDVIDLVLRNNFSNNVPIVQFMQFVVSAVGNSPTPIDLVQLITNSGDFLVTNNGDFLIIN